VLPDRQAREKVVPFGQQQFARPITGRVIAKNTINAYIYRTGDPAEFVIAWPANTDVPSNKDSHLVRDRFRLLNESRPSVSAEVSREPGNHFYTYSYRVANGSGAMTPIWHWAHRRL